MTHSTLFGGSSTTEPITLAAKFTNISAETNSHVEKPDTAIELIQSSPSSETNPEATPEVKIVSQSVVDSSSDLPFSIGIAVGMVVGITIGIVIILIIRQKPSK